MDLLGEGMVYPTRFTRAPRALENHRALRTRLYEQARAIGLMRSASGATVLANDARWMIWVDRMLSELDFRCHSPLNIKGFIAMRFFVYAVLSLLCVQPAVSGQWPVATSIKTQLMGSGGVTYSMTWALINVGDAADVAPPTVQGSVYTGYRLEDKGGAEAFMKATVGQSTHSYPTIGEMALEAWKNTVNGAWAQLVLSTRPADMNRVCIGYRWGRSSGAGGIGTFAETIAPAGTCVNAPPGPEWCKLMSPTLVFDHGSVALVDAEGDISTDTLQVQCTTGTVARLTLAGRPDGSLIVGGTGTAMLASNGLPLTGTVTLPAGTSDLNITSTLHKVPVGSWIASGILILEPE